MTDKIPDYNVSRLELELEIGQHEDTIARGNSRLEEIARQIDLNNRRTALQNVRLGAEADAIRGNKKALEAKIAEIRKNLTLMKDEGATDG